MKTTKKQTKTKPNTINKEKNFMNKILYIRLFNEKGEPVLLKGEPAVAVIIGESTTPNGRDNAYTCKGFDKTKYGNIVDIETGTNETSWPKRYWREMKKFKRDYDVHKILKEKYQHVVTWGGKTNDCRWDTQECFLVKPGHTIEELIQIIINEDTGNVSYNNYGLRPYQRKPFTDVINIFNRGNSEVLLEAAPRFGKSFVSLRVSLNLKKERILILTPFPDAKSSFRDVVESHEMMKDYEFVDLDKIQKNKECLKNDKIVMFLSWQSFSGDNNKTILKKLKPDFFIIDECHRQADTEKSKILIDKICKVNTIQKLFLSATPYDDKVNGDFKNKAEQIVTYDLVEMIDAAKHTSPKFPKMTLNFIDNCADVYYDLKKKGINFLDEEKFTLAKMLADKSNPNYASAFWKRFFCQNFSATGLPSKTLFSELKHQPKHIIIYVPDHGADINTKVFKKLVSDVNCDLYGYVVKQASAEDNAIDIKKLEKDLNSFHEKYEKTITITKGRGTTGVTINKLDCVIIAKTMNSTELFVQTFCRPITPEPGKDEVSIFCFDSEARLNLTGAANVGVNTPNKEAEKRLKRFLDVVNVYHFSENGFTPEPWEEILGFIKEITVKQQSEIHKDLECLDLPEISDEMITLLKASSNDLSIKTNHRKQIGKGGNAGGKTSKYTTEKIKEENPTSNLDITNLIRQCYQTLDWVIVENQCDTAEDLMKLRLHDIDEIDALMLEIIQLNETKFDNICYKYRHTDKDTLLKVLSSLSKTDKIEPPEVINLIFDKADDIFETCDIHAKFFDPCCGRGFYLNEMINRLMQNKNFIKQFPDVNARRIYIKENNIIGNDIEKKFCYILQQAGIKNVTNYDIRHDEFKGVYEKMKFDKIIMNPPYDNKLHLEILEKMFEVCPDAEIINISPIGWLQDIPATLGWKKTTIQRFENIAKRIKNIDIIEGGNEKFGIGSFIDLGIYSFQKTPSNCFYKTLCFDKNKRKDIFDKIILPVYEGKIDNIANQKNNNDNLKISSIHGNPNKKDEFDVVTPKKEIACNNGNIKVSNETLNIKVSDPELYHNMLNTEFFKYVNMLTRQGQHLKFKLMPHIDVTGKFTRETMNEYLFDLFDLNVEQRKFILETMKNYMWADWS